MSKNRKLETCFYCDCVFSTSHSAWGDHFPVPRRNGGIETVPCCKTCHDAKDNISLENWTVQMMVDVINDFPKMSRSTRLFLGRVASVVSDINELNRQKEA